MQISEVAQRYAKALYSLVANNGSPDSMYADIQGIKAALKEDKEIFRILDTPALSTDEKKKFISDSVGKQINSEKLRDFLNLLVDKDRVRLLPEIFEAFQLADDVKNEIARGTVTSSTTLSEDEKSSIASAISTKLNKKVELEFVQDPNLLGGLKAEVGSYRFDGSIKTQMKLLNDEITRRAH